jgi:hypothetical protein
LVVQVNDEYAGCVKIFVTILLLGVVIYGEVRGGGGGSEFGEVFCYAGAVDSFGAVFVLGTGVCGD